MFEIKLKAIYFWTASNILLNRIHPIPLIHPSSDISSGILLFPRSLGLPYYERLQLNFRFHQQEI